MFTEAEMRRIEREDAARLKELGGAPPGPVRVELFSHTLDALGPLLGDKGPCPKGAMCFNIISIPSGMHFHPDDIPPDVRKIPVLVSGAELAARVEPKPSRVVDDREMNTKGEVVPSEVEPFEAGGMGLVTAAEVAMAKAEARAMREEIERSFGQRDPIVGTGNPDDYRIWGGIASRGVGRIDTTWLFGEGPDSVVRAQPSPYPR